MEVLVPQLHRNSDVSFHWSKSDLNKQVTHWGNTLISFPINPGHSSAYCLIPANQGTTQLGFQNRPFGLKYLHGGRNSSKGKGRMRHLLSYLPQLQVASHAAVALRHGVLGIITCRSPKTGQSKKGVRCNLTHFASDAPSHTENMKSILVAHGCLRLES